MTDHPPPTFPNFAGKHESEPLFSPQEALTGLFAALGREWKVPEAVVLYYQSSVGRYLDQHTGVVETDDLGIAGTRSRLHILEPDGVRIGLLGGFGIGAPVAAMVAETIIALGCRRILNVGLAGGLQADVGVGSVAVCSEAVRDEGVSHHYLAPARFAAPSAELTSHLIKTLSDRDIPHRVGPTWTIDAVYRETVAEAKHYRDEGVLTVEMEASAVFAVAEHRGIDAAASFVVADILGEVWEPGGLWTPDTRTALNDLIDVSIDVLAAS